MLKLSHSSREYLIDFIVKSGKLSFIKHYYLQILIQSLFNDYLVKIGKSFNRQPLRCSFKINQVAIEIAWRYLFGITSVALIDIEVSINTATAHSFVGIVVLAVKYEYSHMNQI